MVELTEREQKVLTLRQEGLTLERIAKILGITRERVRQIESKAMKKLKFNERHQFDNLDNDVAKDLEKYPDEKELLKALRYELKAIYDPKLKNFACSLDLKCMKPKNAEIIKRWLEL